MKDQRTSTERRDFLKKAAAAAMVTGFPAVISAQTVTNAIKVGLVGCGGRGSVGRESFRAGRIALREPKTSCGRTALSGSFCQ